MLVEQNNHFWKTISINYYDYPKTEPFLVEVSELIYSVLGMKTKFFYSRLFEPGPIIKVRIYCEDNTIEKKIDKLIEIVKQKIIETTSFDITTEDYINYYLGPYRYGVNHLLWPAHGTVSLGDYEQEIDRYGGKIGVAMAEEVFCAATNYILGELKSSEECNSFETKIKIAFGLTICIIERLNMNQEESSYFLRTVAELWMKVNYSKIPMSINKEVMVKQLIGILEDCYNNRANYYLCNSWMKYYKTVRVIADYFNSNKVKCSPRPIDSLNLQVFIKKYDKPFYFPRVAISLLHMNLNKIGIYLYSEPVFLYSISDFLGMHKLDDISYKY